MFKALVIIFFMFSAKSSFSQPDTVIKKSQKGLLVLSAYNYLYDYSGGHMRPVGFHDYFFPTNENNPEHFFDTTKSFAFANGRHIQFFPERFYYKKRAKKFVVKNNINCYSYDTLYLLPVILEFKEYKDNWPPVCESNTFQIKIIGGSTVNFSVSANAIDVKSSREQRRQKAK